RGVRPNRSPPSEEVAMWCRLSRIALGFGVLAAMPGIAGAGCTTTQDASVVRRSLNQGMHCADKFLRSGPGASCTVTTPPACAGTLATDAVALAYGGNDPATAAVVDRSGLRDQLRCQKKIGTAVA